MIRNPVEASWREQCTAATKVGFGDSQCFVQAYPARFAGGFPFAAADGEPCVIISVVVIRGDEQAKDVWAVTADNQHGAFPQGGGRHVEPHHLAGFSLPVHVRCIENTARNVSGGEHFGACGATMVLGGGIAQALIEQLQAFFQRGPLPPECALSRPFGAPPHSHGSQPRSFAECVTVIGGLWWGVVKHFPAYAKATVE